MITEDVIQEAEKNFPVLRTTKEEWVDIKSIQEIPQTPFYSQSFDDEGYDIAAVSLNDTGQIYPIIINQRPDGAKYIIDGVQRLKILSDGDIQEVAVKRLYLTEEDEEKLHVELNTQATIMIEEVREKFFELAREKASALKKQLDDLPDIRVPIDAEKAKGFKKIVISTSAGYKTVIEHLLDEIIKNSDLKRMDHIISKALALLARTLENENNEN